MREVKDLMDAEDERQAEREQRVDRSHDDAIENLLRKHGDAPVLLIFRQSTTVSATSVRCHSGRSERRASGEVEKSRFDRIEP